MLPGVRVSDPSGHGEDRFHPVGPLALLTGCSPGTGLVHCKFNQLYLKGHAEYWDVNPPTLILIPTLELSKVLDWNGTEDYDLLPMTVGGGHGRVCSQDVLEAAQLRGSEVLV